MIYIIKGINFAFAIVLVFLGYANDSWAFGTLGGAMVVLNVGMELHFIDLRRHLRQAIIMSNEGMILAVQHTRSLSDEQFETFLKERQKALEEIRALPL